MKTTRELFKALIDIEWAETPIIAEENDQDQPPDDLRPFVTISYFTMGEEPASIGAGCYRAEGINTLRAWIASGTDYDVGIQLIEKLRDLYRSRYLTDGLRLTTASPAEPDADGSDGNWYSYKTEIGYIHEYTKRGNP